MSLPEWPASLRQLPRRSSWTGGPMDLRRRFEPDAGDAIVRRATTAEVEVYEQVTFPNLSDAQRQTFVAFYRDTLQNGSLPFVWSDPVTGEAWLWRIRGDGTRAYVLTAKGAGNHDLTLNLLRRPGRPWWSIYAAPRISAVPVLVMDFVRGVYGVRGQQRSLSSLMTFTRASSAVRVNPSRLLETVSANVARFDHDPDTGAALGLLIEEARTNLCLHSEAFDNAAWIKTSTTVTANASASPSGAVTADRLVAGNGIAAGNAPAEQSVALAAGTAFAASVFVKADGMRAQVLVRARTGAAALLGTATLTLSTDGRSIAASSVGPFTGAAWRIEPHANGWTRVILEGVAPATTATVWPGVANGDAGTGAAGVLAWGAQVEAGAFVTSYIATTTVAVARAVETASVEGAAYAQWAPGGAATVLRRLRPDNAVIGTLTSRMMTSLGVPGANDSFVLRMTRHPSAPTGTAFVFDDGVLQVIAPEITLPVPVRGVEIAQAMSWEAGQFRYAASGQIVGPGTFAGQPTPDRMFLLGAETNGAAQDAAHLARVVVFDRRIADDSLREMVA